MNTYPILLDCDPGHDDVMAILMLCGNPNLHLLGITVSAGNSTLENTSRNALGTLELIGRNDIPVCLGKDKPLYSKLSIADSVHGRSGLDGVTLPNIQKEPVKKDCSTFIHDLVLSQDTLVDLIVTGPQTNIAQYLLDYPEDKPHIHQILSMGGSAFSGNWSPYAEFNIWQDPEAADIVYRSGIPHVMCGLEATNLARISKEEMEDFRLVGNKTSEFFYGLCKFFADQEPDLPKDQKVEVPMHDAIPITYLINPSLIEMKDAYVSIGLEGEKRGQTICDFESDKPNAKVSLNLNTKEYLKELKRSIENLP